MEEPDSEHIANPSDKQTATKQILRGMTYQVIEEEGLEDISQIEVADQSMRKSEIVEDKKLTKLDSH